MSQRYVAPHITNLADGRKRITFKDQHGKWHRFRFKDQEEANRKVAEIQGLVAQGMYVDPDEIPTVSEIAQLWLQTKKDLRPSSYAAWENHVNNHIIPALGNVIRIDQVRFAQAEALKEAVRKNVSAGMTNKVLTTAEAIFKFALKHEEWGVLRNPFELVERCKRGTDEVHLDGKRTERQDPVAVDPNDVPFPAEVALIVQHAPSLLYQVLFTIVAVMGLRVGEATALRWPDLDESWLHVRHTLAWKGTRSVKDGERLWSLWAPKSARGVRDLPIPKGVALLLKKWRLACPPTDEGWVFPNEDGGPKHRSVIYHQGLVPALKKAQLKRRVTIHSLRHVCASDLIERGRPLTEVQKILGHEDAATTARLYTHFFGRLKDGVLDGMDGVVCSGVDNPVDKLQNCTKLAQKARCTKGKKL